MDLLSQYNKQNDKQDLAKTFSIQPRGQSTVSGFLVRSVMALSMGRIRDEKSAVRALVGVSICFLLVSIIMVSGMRKGGSATSVDPLHDPTLSDNPNAL